MANFDNIIQEINTNLPDNNTQSITAAKLRTTLIDLTTQIDTVQDEYEAEVDSKIVFETGQPVSNVTIDESHLTAFNQDDTNYPTVAKVSDIIPIKLKIADIDFNVDNLDVSVTTGQYVRGDNGGIISTAAANYATADITGYPNIIINGKQLISTSVTGYCFYNESNEPILVGNSIYTIGTTLEDKEYKLSVPANAKYIKWTVKMAAYTVDNPYCYGVSGHTLTDLIEDAVEPLQEDIDDIQDNIVDIDESLEKKSYNELSEDEYEESKRCNSDGTTQGSTYVDLLTFLNIDDTKTYRIYAKYNASTITGIYLLNYFNGNQFLGNELLYNNLHRTEIDRKITLPPGTNKILLNYANSSFVFNLYEVVDEGYYDFEQMNDDIESLKDELVSKQLKVDIKTNEAITVRSKYDDENDIMIEIGYYTAYRYRKNSWWPLRAYLGSNEYSDSELKTNGIRQNISDTVGPITMDFCGPIYANHGFCTPRVTIVGGNPLTTEDIGSLWHDNVASLFGSDSGYREYTVVNVSGNYIYLMPVIMGEPGDEKRDWVYYNSTDPQTLYHMSGGTHTDDMTVNKTSRWDYQMCECKNQKIYLDGIEHSLSDFGTFYCNELTIGYQQICYDPCSVTIFWPTPDYTNVPLKVIFDRQFIFSGSKGYLSYSSSHKMNVLMPFKLGQEFTGDPNGRYIGIAPTGFLKQTNTYSNYDSYSFIDKLVRQYNGNGGDDYSIDFTKEFISNYDTHPVVSLYRNTNNCADINNMPDRMYSYLKDPESNEIGFGVAGGHSIVRGMSIPSVRNTMIEEESFMGWWNPPVYNKLYLPVMTHGDDGTTVTSDFIRTGEGFFCWYKPQVTDTTNFALVHSFYYKSGSEYILYIHTRGSHNKSEKINVPSILNGKSIDSIIEQSSDRISLAGDIVLSDTLHINVNANSNDECNYIVLKIK